MLKNPASLSFAKLLTPCLGPGGSAANGADRSAMCCAGVGWERVVASEIPCAKAPLSADCWRLP